MFRIDDEAQRRFRRALAADSREARIADLERRAELLEQQAEEREDHAAIWYGVWTPGYVCAFDDADTRRAQARELHEEAARLRGSP